MACPALPLCGLAIGEAERTLPDVNARLRAVMDKVGLPRSEKFVVRMTGERGGVGGGGPRVLSFEAATCFGLAGRGQVRFRLVPARTRLIPWEAARGALHRIQALALSLLAAHLLPTSVPPFRPGCPNGCARPYMAELGFVGDGPNSYQIWLGGSTNATRLAEPFAERVKSKVSGGGV